MTFSGHDDSTINIVLGLLLLLLLFTIGAAESNALKLFAVFFSKQPLGISV